jgi:Tol biopolymer transport system component
MTPVTASPVANSVAPSPSPTAVDAQPGFYLLYQAGEGGTLQQEIYRSDFTNSRLVAPGDLVPGQPLSPDQKRIVITTRPTSWTDDTRSHVVLDLEQGTMEPLPLIAPSSHLFWSPDGRQLMYASYPEDRGQLVVYDFEKGENIVLFDDQSVWSTAGWSADGKLAAFVAVTDGQYDLYVLEVDTLAVRRLTDTTDIETGTVWSPVSDELLVGTTVYTEHAFELWPYAVDGLSIISSDGQERDLGRYDYLQSSSLAWSPDGESVAYSEKGKLCMLSLGDGQWDCPLVDLEPYGTYIAAFDVPPVWSPDNRWLVFRAAGYDDGSACEAVYALELATGEVVVVEEGSCNVGPLYWVGP